MKTKLQRGRWIKTDGTEEQVLPADGKEFDLKELQAMVGGYIQMVETRAPARIMYINEEGMLTLLPINAKASELIDPRYWVVDGVRGNVVVIEVA